MKWSGREGPGYSPTSTMMLLLADDLSAVSTALLQHPLTVVASGSRGLPALTAFVAALLVLRASLRIARVLASTAVALGVLAALVALVMHASSGASPQAGASVVRRSTRPALTVAAAPATSSLPLIVGVAAGVVPALLGLGLLSVARRRTA